MRDRLTPARLLALVCSSLAVLGGARAGCAETVVAGTWSQSGSAHVLIHEDGVGWSRLPDPPPAPNGWPVPCSQFWDVELIDGDVWAACHLPPRVLRWDGGAWHDETPAAGGGGFVAVFEFEGAVHVVERSALLRREASGTWTWLAGFSQAGQADVSTAHDGRPMIFVGQDSFDEFWVHDPLELLACGETCPSTSGAACPAGCHGGSCVFAMEEHDDGTGPQIYAGAYSGAMYDWDESGRRFVRYTGPTHGHVQGLASHAGTLWLGDSRGELHAKAGTAAWVLERGFGLDWPISELESIGPRLWVATGGVPFGFARSSGSTSVWTFDGDAWVDLSEPGFFDSGVIAFAGESDPNAVACSAGPDQLVECTGAPIEVQLDGTASLLGGLGPDQLVWTGGFLEGEVTGLQPTVHFSAPGDYTIHLELAGTGETCLVTIRIRDTQPPELVGLEESLALACDEPLPSPPAVGAWDACDPSPTVDFEESLEEGPCEDSFAIEWSWVATDAEGHEAHGSQRVTVLDVEAPTLSGVPADDTVPCDDVPAPASVGAADDCDPDPALVFAQERLPGPCEDSHRLERTWTATDRCGNVSAEVQVLEVVDSQPPVLHGVPADGSVSCDAVPVPASVGASDDCDPSPSLEFEERREDGACPDRYLLRRTWTSLDRCGNVASATQVLEVRDDQRPVLGGIPADAVVECDAVPPPATPSVSDACDPDPRLDFVELREDGPCPDQYTLRRTWTATDRCGNATSATQVLEVVDTQPPVVEASDELVACLWPPNHARVCIDRELLAPVIRDACSEEVTWRLAGCVSSQPDDELGDGAFTEDCVVSPDGESACLRSERQGTEPAGRDYGLAIVATDACGNESAPVVVGRVHVPHDATGLRDCPRVLRSRP